MGRAYYNEFDPYAAQWLRNLISAGLIAPGDVDDRSIIDVRPDDLRGYTQCHFFAGIGGWSCAARLAGWPDDRELWTGSCPCQPFSITGKQKGKSDKRHLWPVFFALIRASRPDVVMGEQVAAAVGHHWLDGVHSDMEGIGYAVGAAIIPACAVDAPHRRDRLWFVADTDSQRRQPGNDAAQATRYGYSSFAEGGDVGHSVCHGTQYIPGSSDRPESPPLSEHRSLSGSGATAWGDGAWSVGGDGKARRIEPRIRLLADGVPGRVEKLRAYGNAIVPQVAAEVIAAYLEARSAA